MSGIWIRLSKDIKDHDRWKPLNKVWFKLRLASQCTLSSHIMSPVLKIPSISIWCNQHDSSTKTVGQCYWRLKLLRAGPLLGLAGKRLPLEKPTLSFHLAIIMAYLVRSCTQMEELQQYRGSNPHMCFIAALSGFQTQGSVCGIVVMDG